MGTGYSCLEYFCPALGIEQSVFVQEMGWVLALRELGSWARASLRFPNCQEVLCLLPRDVWLLL